jgi:cyclopropane fatty-acyl-phospholipid synthase-like methyltransferase
MNIAKKYWDDYFTQKPFASGKEPNPFLIKMLPRLQKGKVLDIGMGEGVNAVYLAMKGFKVKGFDISQVAVERAIALARDTGVELEAQCIDLDLYLMGLLEYDSIVMTFFKPSVVRYYSEMIRALKQGGTLLIDSYTTQEMGEALAKDEAFKNYYFSCNEVLRNLPGLQILFYQEGIIDGKHVTQCLARKPIDKDAAKYNLFDMQTKHTDTEKSKHLELAEKFFKK